MTDDEMVVAFYRSTGHVVLVKKLQRVRVACGMRRKGKKLTDRGKLRLESFIRENWEKMDDGKLRNEYFRSCGEVVFIRKIKMVRHNLGLKRTQFQINGFRKGVT